MCMQIFSNRKFKVTFFNFILGSFLLGKQPYETTPRFCAHVCVCRQEASFIDNFHIVGEVKEGIFLIIGNR